ncbi:MAG: OB-fold nucleic acid binding domain-containing protein, partial [Thermodesulfobacteriota bacterium]
MRGRIALISIALVATAVFSGCSKPAEKEEDVAVKREAPGVNTIAPAQAAIVGGVVVETFDVEGYTYLNLEDPEKGPFWAAVPPTKAAVGDWVEIGGASLMSNFHSKTLNKTFEYIFFGTSSRITSKKSTGTVSEGVPPGHPPQFTGPVEMEAVEKVEGGYTVAGLYAKKKELAGKEVKVRGRVVKYMEGIMGMNWVHLRDGTGSEGTNDVTITTKQKTRKGDIIVATGKLSMDKDFGGGYN